MEALGRTLQARKEQLLAAIKEDGLPPPETRSLTRHKLKQGHVKRTLAGSVWEKGNKLRHLRGAGGG